jgi:hypothetical protein
MSRVQIALGAGLAVIVAAIAFVLSSSPLVALGTNGIAPSRTLAETSSRSTACQSGERVPRGTRAIRISIGGFNGPAMSVRMFEGAHPLTSGGRGSDWAGQTVTVPVALVTAAAYPVTVCFTSELVRGELLEIYGSQTEEGVAAISAGGQPLGGRVQITYLGTGRSSWLALASSVASHMGFGRDPSGTWVAFLVAALMLAIAALATRLALGELDD